VNARSTAGSLHRGPWCPNTIHQNRIGHREGRARCDGARGGRCVCVSNAGNRDPRGGPGRAVPGFQISRPPVRRRMRMPSRNRGRRGGLWAHERGRRKCAAPAGERLGYCAVGSMSGWRRRSDGCARLLRSRSVSRYVAMFARRGTHQAESPEATPQVASATSAKTEPGVYQSGHSVVAIGAAHENGDAKKRGRRSQAACGGTHSGWHRGCIGMDIRHVRCPRRRP
jgi:hypothetical protein